MKDWRGREVAPTPQIVHLMTMTGWTKCRSNGVAGNLLMTQEEDKVTCKICSGERYGKKKKETEVR